MYFREIMKIPSEVDGAPSYTDTSLDKEPSREERKPEQRITGGSPKEVAVK
jgi:hypothetical protein